MCKEVCSCERKYVFAQEVCSCSVYVLTQVKWREEHATGAPAPDDSDWLVYLTEANKSLNVGLMETALVAADKVGTTL